MKQKASEGTLNVKDALELLPREQDSLPYPEHNNDCHLIGVPVKGALVLEHRHFRPDGHS